MVLCRPVASSRTPRGEGLRPDKDLPYSWKKIRNSPGGQVSLGGQGLTAMARITGGQTTGAK